jgi:hypothetical protein
MDVHKEFINQILRKRKAALRDLIAGEASLDLESLKPNLGKLIDELDRIFYTIEFLEKENLIKLHTYNNSYPITLFNGFVPAMDDVESSSYWFNKLEKHDYSLEIEMRPGLMAFKNNGFKTDEQIKERRNFWLPIFVGVGSAAITALLGALLSKSYELYPVRHFPMFLHYFYR